MNKRNHLNRLPDEYYWDDAVVHWTLTIRERRQGWLGGMFLYRFRELLTHSAFRYGIACPIFCLMPDHIHMLWMGIAKGSNQLNAMKHFRPRCSESLERIGFELQDQAFDHVLTEEDRIDSSLWELCEYIARNPERAGLLALDEFKSYKFTGCLVPGYPELRPFDEGYWDKFNRIVSFLRKDGLLRVPLQP